MVTRREMRELARRHDTVVARAFRKALGMAPRPRHGHGRHRRRRPRAHPAEWRYRGIAECFRNLDSPADWHRRCRG